MESIYDTFSVQEKHNIITQLFNGKTSEFRAMCQEIDRSNTWLDKLLILNSHIDKYQWKYFRADDRDPFFKSSSDSLFLLRQKISDFREKD